jgi:hypothetical protein
MSNSAYTVAKLSGHLPSPISSQIQEGQDGESSEILQVQVQHAPELLLVRHIFSYSFLQALTICSGFQQRDDFDVSTRAAILRAEGARLRRIHGQVYNIYKQEKEMSEMIDEIIDELDDAEEQDLM